MFKTLVNTLDIEMADTVAAIVEQTTSFAYRPLRDSDGIRLLLLEPPSKDNPELVRGHIQHTTLTQCVRDLITPYTALSYVWGDASDKKTILVDGFPVQITSNLYDALRDIRDESRELRLWADALCINQDDNDERALQVGLMGRIYWTAAHTIIYLDSTSHDYLDRPLEYSFIDVPKYHILLKSPWFRRAWVFQEAVMSRDPWIQLDRWRCPWKDLDTFINGRVPAENSSRSQDAAETADAMEEDGFPDISSTTKILRQICKARTAFQTPQLHKSANDHATSLLGLVQARRGLGATDARDQIFAYLGVAADRERMSVKADYTKECAQVYKEFARLQIQHGNIHEVLACLIGRNYGILANDLPSWVSLVLSLKLTMVKYR